MPTLDFKGKTVIETYHHTVPHHRLEFDAALSLLPKWSNWPPAILLQPFHHHPESR
ncbi:MAG: hypothetical protein H6811_01840 [Phycisphaeraceae bacterium]|nr:hypothetical protein [Phycisphaeraceae bacterium]